MRPTFKKKPTKLRAWRVSLLRQRAHYLGTVEAAGRKGRRGRNRGAIRSRWRAAQAVSGARAGSKQLSLGGADASNVFHLWRTRTNAARRSARWASRHA